MGWFGRKRTQEKQVEALSTVVSNFFEVTTKGGSSAPIVLNFALPDSRFRYLFFALSAGQTACARYMSNPDAILNDLAHRLITYAVAGDDKETFGVHSDAQAAANQGSALLADYLHRWSAYVDIAGSNEPAAVGIIMGMLKDIESDGEPTSADVARLGPLAGWIHRSLESMGRAFENMAG